MKRVKVRLGAGDHSSNWESTMASARRLARNDVAEHSSSSTDQVSASTEKTAASAAEIAATAEQLSGNAEEPGRLVSQFKLAD